MKAEINEPENGASPATVEIDVQDPLPEQDWTWRRTYTYGLTLITCGFLLYALISLHRLDAPDHIYVIAKLLIGVIAMMATYYMVAPSAEQIVHLIQAARTLRAGVPLSRKSTVQTPQRKIVAESSAGVDAEPISPPADDEEDVAPRSRT